MTIWQDSADDRLDRCQVELRRARLLLARAIALAGDALAALEGHEPEKASNNLANILRLEDGKGDETG